MEAAPQIRPRTGREYWRLLRDPQGEEGGAGQRVCKVRIPLAQVIVKDHNHSHFEFPQHFHVLSSSHTTTLDTGETHDIIIFIQSPCYIGRNCSSQRLWNLT